MNNAASQRRRVFIKKAFQARFMAGVVGLILLSSLSSALLIYWITGGDLLAQSQSAHASIVTAWERLGLSILLGNLVAVLVAGAAGVASTLYASHKIAGPLYRFETLCQEVGDGNLDPVTRLREDDQLQELAEAFSSMVTKLRERRERQAGLLVRLDQHLDVLRSCDNLNPQQRKSLEELSQVLAELNADGPNHA
ncbi:hypothetical protein IVG45_06465 [Methylomonas sp. LL1]|uniref:hypothetical protein n=1 Tax=Methylomonas sp. LL1 TaxID=2785785 RepID=UPI0018C39C44|nr:hypothetical protein [Methylomonas sp. LL1]QPK64595.1 hypothetical protein IVG45_06465 [Methylomonas sp. LL1]CAG1022252.1 hypothetical protein MTYM_01584 [Methylococcales bacterium]